MSGHDHLAARLLRQRWLVRAPIRLYRAGLGGLLGSRFLLLEHRGRSSGLARQAVLEVVGRPRPGRFVVVSGMGRRAQWFRNVQAEPRVLVSTGGRRHLAAIATELPPAEAEQALRIYASAHPTAEQRLRGVLEETLGEPIVPGDTLPVVALDLVPQR